MADNKRNTERVIVESDSNGVDRDRTYDRDRVTESRTVRSDYDRNDYDRHDYDGRPVRRISWGAIFAGALTALLTLLLLNLLFYGIGISTINPASEQNALSGLGTGALIATVISNLVALFLGGYVAGKLAGTPRRFPSLMHGVLTWALLTLFTIYLGSTAIGSLVSGVTGAVGSAFSAATSGISSAASAIPGSAVPNSPQGAAGAVNQIPGISNVQQQIDQLLNRAGVQNPQQASQQLARVAVNRVQAGDSLTSDQAQQQFSDIIGQNSELSDQEVEQQVQQFTQNAQQQVDQAQQQAAETAQTAANAVGTVSIIAFFVLLVGAGVAAAGSAFGSPKDERDAHRVS